MTKKNEHIKNTYKELSILASLYGLSFMMKSDKKNHKKFFEYTFDATNPFILSNKLIEIFIERNLSEYNFQQIKFIHHNPLNTLVPTIFFNEKNAQYFLDKNIKVFNNDKIEHDILEDFQVTNIYIPFKQLNKFLLSKTKDLVTYHSLSVFLEKISFERKNNFNLPIFEIYLSIFPKDFQILVFKNSQLQLSNHFKYENIDEFLYYLFFVWETLDIQNDKMHIYLSGIKKEHLIIKNLSDFTTNYTLYPSSFHSSINNYIID